MTVLRSPNVRHGALIAATTLAVAAVIVVPDSSPAEAAAVHSTEYPGRTIGSGGYGYIGQFGVNNPRSTPAAFDFYFPYGISVAGDKIFVADSGLAPREVGSQEAGHSLQGFTLTGKPGNDGIAYTTNGEWTVSTHQTEPNPQNLVRSDLILAGDPEVRGHRGVATDADGNVYVVTSNSSPFIKKYSPAGVELARWGAPGVSSDPARMTWPVGIAVDAEGDIYVTAEGYAAVVVFDSSGNLRGRYLGAATADKPLTAPGRLNSPQSIAIDRTGGGIYVGDIYAGGRQGKIHKLRVNKAAGLPATPENPNGWEWSVDTSFGAAGAVNAGPFSSVMSLQVDQANGDVLSVLGSGGIARRDSTGANITSIGSVGGGVHDEGRTGTVRGMAVDARGFVYATTQQNTNASNTRSLVQIFARTPSPLAGLSAVAGPESVTLTWDASAVGHGQADVLDYVVERSSDGGATWATIPQDARSTATTRVITGLTPGTETQFRVRAFSEAGSGDPATAAAVPEVVIEPTPTPTPTEPTPSPTPTEPSPTPTSTPTDPAPTATAGPVPPSAGPSSSGTPSIAPGGHGGLPGTGSAGVPLLAGVAMLLLIAGVWIRTRRRDA